MTPPKGPVPTSERAANGLASALARAPRGLSIRTRLVALVLAVALPSAGLIAYSIVDAANEARMAAYGQVSTLAAFTANRLDNILRDQEQLLARLAGRPRITALDPKSVDPLVREMVPIHPELSNLGIRDRNAASVYSFRPNPTDAESARDFPWFREGIASGRFTVGDAFTGRLSGRVVTVLTYPIRDNRGDVAGLINFSVDLLRLQERVMQATPRDALVVVIDRQDRYLMRSSGIEQWIGKPVPAHLTAQIRGLREGLHELTGVDGVRRIFAVAIVPVAGWRVFAGLPVDTFLAPHRERLAESAAIGALVLAIALALAYAIGSAIARPIGELARAASDLDGAGLALDPATGTAEVDAVARRLSRLAREREQARGERAAIVDHYERILKAARDAYLLLDEEARIADFNDATVAAYGYAPDELRGMAVAQLRAPQARDSLEKDWRDAARPGGALYETLHMRRDGTIFPVEASTRVVEIAGRTYRQGLVRDISARKAAEDVLRRQNEVLDRFNRAAVGRELEVIELKRKVNELARALGRQAPYPLAFLDGPDPPGDVPDPAGDGRQGR